MKKMLCMAMLCVVLLSTALSALANGWGLKGQLLTAVSRDSRWNAYTTVCAQAGDVAVLGARYHNALMLLDADGRLQVYTKAVYQPEKKMDKKLKVTQLKNGFELSYGEESRFVFVWFDTECKLIEAKHGDVRMIRLQDYCYEAVLGTEKTNLSWNVTVENFNINLFPQSIEEIRNLEYLRAALDSGRWILNGMNDGDLFEDLGTGTAAVYSAPDTASWRAAKGKAAVGLRGEVWVHGEVVNERGEKFFSVRYDVSQRTQRVGYVKSTAVRSDLIRYDFTEDLIAVPLTVACDTYLTDDPDVSQYTQFTLARGTKLTCLALYDDYYAYVAYENGKELVWGFVPLRDVAVVQDEYRQVQHDIMAKLAGKWCFTAGGSMGPEYMELHADGTCIVHSPQGDDMGVVVQEYTWQVTRYHPAWKLYWSDVPYELTLISDTGSVNIKGLDVEREGEVFSLINFEGGGGYERIEMLPGEQEGVTILDREPLLEGNG